MMPQAPRRPSARARGASTIRPRLPPPIKKLFNVEAKEGEDDDVLTKEFSESIKAKIQMDYELDMSLRAQEKENHEKRLKSLRDLLKTVSQDDWQYTSADKLIGLH